MARPAMILALGLLGAWPAIARSGQAEIKVDRDFLARLLEKLPACPFETAGRYRGRVDSFRLVAIAAKSRQMVVSCQIAGEFDERSIVAGLTQPRAASDRPTPPPSPVPRWSKFRFDVQVAVNIEPGLDGAPRFRFEVKDVRRRELDGLAGTLAKVMGRRFDAIVTAFADKKAAGLDSRLNDQILKRVGVFTDYGLLSGVDYAPTQIVLKFDQTRFRSEGVAGYVSLTERAGTVPFYRWVNPRNGVHFYTTNPVEPDRRIYRSEGIACYVLAAPETGSVPLYRWRGKVESFYTASAREAEPLRRAGFRLEGIACHVFAEPRPDTVPFYRFLDPLRGLHFYTIDPRAEFAK